METALAVMSIIAAVVSLAAALRARAAVKRAHHHRSIATGYAEASRQRAQWLHGRTEYHVTDIEAALREQRKMSTNLRRNHQ